MKVGRWLPEAGEKLMLGANFSQREAPRVTVLLHSIVTLNSDNVHFKKVEQSVLFCFVLVFNFIYLLQVTQIVSPL